MQHPTGHAATITSDAEGVRWTCACMPDDAPATSAPDEDTAWDQITEHLGYDPRTTDTGPENTDNVN